MTALRLVSGPGITDRAMAEEACVELAVHQDEALRFCDRARVHARSLEWASRDIGAMHRHAMALLALIEGYDRRHSEPPDVPVEGAA